MGDGTLGVLAITDVDVYGQKCKFGFGSRNLGGVLSMRRMRKDVFSEQHKYKNYEEEESMTLQRFFKMATHFVGNVLGLANCTYYECLMKGFSHMKQVDKHPCYFCPVCYRKLHKVLQFDHIKRYRELAHLCKELGYSFTEPIKKIDKQSYHGWFESRIQHIIEKEK